MRVIVKLQLNFSGQIVQLMPVCNPLRLWFSLVQSGGSACKLLVVGDFLILIPTPPSFT